jgi:two-component system, LytTR family, response regulator
MDHKPSIKPLVIKTNTGDTFFDYDDILRFESDDCTCHIHLTKGGVLTTPVKISKLEEVLPDHIYFKTHRCHIINLSFVSNLNDKTSIITVAESEVPLSETYYDAFKKLYNSGDDTQYIH